MTKEKTALVIPNAIEIKTERERHFFTSFAARDKTYAMLYKLWLNSMRIDQVRTASIGSVRLVLGLGYQGGNSIGFLTA